MSGRVEVVCLSTADWDAALWTNKQHLMYRLADRGVRVLYVDSLGLRAPTINSRDIKRILQRLRRWKPTARAIKPGLLRDSPLVIPLQRRTLVRLINRVLMRRRLGRNMRGWGFERPVLWTYTPAAVDIYDPKLFSGVIYHCVDDLAAFPGVDSASFREQEMKLVSLADISIASSRPLFEHLQSLGAVGAKYWPNPADTESFASVARARDTTRPTRVRPRIGFVGAIQEHKVDVELILACANLRPDWDFELIGPIGFGVGHSDMSKVEWPSNVALPGLATRDELPRVLARFDVGIIPYRLNEYTRAVFPMKVYEYLAAGLGVVSTPIPSIMGEVDYVAFAEEPGGFVAAIQRFIEADRKDVDISRARLEYASKASWTIRTTEAHELIRSLREQNL